METGGEEALDRLRAAGFTGETTVVTLDPKETYCGCGGRGHLEGIMGHRAMRLRFLDLEPDEIFANARLADESARDSDPSCVAVSPPAAQCGAFCAAVT